MRTTRLVGEDFTELPEENHFETMKALPFAVTDTTVVAQLILSRFLNESIPIPNVIFVDEDRFVYEDHQYMLRNCTCEGGCAVCHCQK